MGTEVRCRKCGEVLLELDGVPADLLWYSRLRCELAGKCPGCGHRLPSILSFGRKFQFEVKAVIPVVAK